MCGPACATSSGSTSCRTSPFPTPSRPSASASSDSAARPQLSGSNQAGRAGTDLHLKSPRAPAVSSSFQYRVGPGGPSRWWPMSPTPQSVRVAQARVCTAGRKRRRRRGLRNWAVQGTGRRGITQPYCPAPARAARTAPSSRGAGPPPQRMPRLDDSKCATRAGAGRPAVATRAIVGNDTECGRNEEQGGRQLSLSLFLVCVLMSHPAKGRKQKILGRKERRSAEVGVRLQQGQREGGGGRRAGCGKRGERGGHVSSKATGYHGPSPRPRARELEGT